MIVNRKKCLWWLGLLIWLVLAGSVQANQRIEGVRLWPAPDHTRLVFDLSGPVQHRVFMLDNPKRLVIDVQQVRLQTEMNPALQGTPIARIRSAPRDGQHLRIVLDLAQDVQPRSFLLRPNQQYGHRLVVDLMLSDPHATTAQSASQRAAAVAQAPRRGEARPIVIAIDPGHGGEDPGAIGPAGTREKLIVFSIAQELARILEADPAFKTVLTRTGDYYVGLRQRVVIARQARADLFVSIHADAYRSPQPRGSSVYILSQRGASSESARWLANSENRADLIGGVEGVLTLDDKDDVLANVLVDLSMTATLSESLNVGNRVLRNMGQINRLHKREVEQAGFMVLRSPDMPSMLIEAGFISNPQEEQRLRDRQYQRQMARQIADGIIEYFRDNPPPHSLLAQQGPPAREYTIRRGDTLSDIARRNGVDIGELRRLNNLNNDVIQVGQQLRIPSS